MTVALTTSFRDGITMSAIYLLVALQTLLKGVTTLVPRFVIKSSEELNQVWIFQDHRLVWNVKIPLLKVLEAFCNMI